MGACPRTLTTATTLPPILEVREPRPSPCWRALRKASLGSLKCFHSSAACGWGVATEDSAPPIYSAAQPSTVRSHTVATAVAREARRSRPCSRVGLCVPPPPSAVLCAVLSKSIQIQNAFCIILLQLKMILYS